ncbi:kelch repeat-containing protein [Polyangium sp. 15x6]|uniref:Kelch repeat-containing protein n=1 Tax=Polyangium sp. 15x6 TaxID=3042687 RepID=UPI00249AFD3D|nr:kelch repeat-containing protein [Polyangium sp. 15x6]MDI3284233.1 kelch repeat-containing protein [Polyangium sp. 15x6]
MQYPILVDPAWESTGKLVQARTRAAVAEVELPSSPGSRALLVTGGVGMAGAPLSSAEIYFPLERSFAIVGSSMNDARSHHTATNLADDGSGKVAIVGGRGTLGLPLDGVEIYNPQSGMFTTKPAMHMSWHREGHTATLLANGRLLLAGGTASTDPVLITPQSTNSVEIFEPLTETTTELLVGKMKAARTAHAALRLSSGEVLLTGGFGTADFALFTAERFDPLTQQFQFTASQMSASRARHTMTLLEGGDVLVAGGINATKKPATVRQTAEIYSAATNDFGQQALDMLEARAGHTSTRLTTGEVLLVGGFNGDDPATPNYLATTYLFHPATNAFTKHIDMSAVRGDHVAARLIAGDSVDAGQGVLVLGGAGPGTTLDTAEILVNLLGDPCTRDDECLSGHCATRDQAGVGVCCNEACDGVCRSCRVGEKVDPSTGVCSFADAGTLLGWNCVDEGKDIPIEFRLKCDGKGNPVPEDGNSCGPNGCDHDAGRCSDQCPCSDAGYCTDAAAEDAGDPAPPSGERCELRMPNGLKCDPTYGGRDCQSGSCKDGFCCNKPCDGQCEACNVQGFEGTCTPAGFLGNAAPVGDREPCAGQDGSQCKGFCDKDDRSQCTYLDDTVDFTECGCNASGCEQTNHVCDGKGGSNPELASCGGFLCGDDACKTSCASDADCGEDFFCEDAACKALPFDGRCDGDHTIRIPEGGRKPDGRDEDCGPIKCVPATSECKPTCVSVLDCVGERICSLDGRCIEPPPSPPPPSCSAAPGSRSTSAGLALLTALVALAGRRRRS